jgi:predicted DNA-binding transcriptional regulator AlpA
MKVYSTRQAAQKLGISFPTLNRYIGDKKISVPPVTELGTARVRVWTDQDIEKVREVLPKIANGRKTRYKKKGTKPPNKKK